MGYFYPGLCYSFFWKKTRDIGERVDLCGVLRVGDNGRRRIGNEVRGKGIVLIDFQFCVCLVLLLLLVVLSLLLLCVGIAK